MPLIISLTGMLLLMLVYMLPTQPMKDNIFRSADTFNQEGVYPMWASNYKLTQLDNWTEATILGMAINSEDEGRSPLRRALECNYIDRDGSPITLTLTDYAHDIPGDYRSVPYGRYWYGMLVVVKPFLMLFDYTDLRVFHMIVEILLIAYIVKLLYRENCGHFALPFFIGILLMCVPTVMMSICFSCEFIPMQLFCIYVLKKRRTRQASVAEKTEDNPSSIGGWAVAFCTMGCLTNFFNTLSSPFIALVMPLLVWIWTENSGTKKAVHSIILAFLWGFGYGAVWLWKWILATLITHYNYLENAFGQASFYQNREESITLWDRLWKNIECYMKWPFFILIVLVLVYYCGLWRKSRKSVRNYFVKQADSVLSCCVPRPFLLF